MSRKLKFKIISCSSDEQEHPASSLLFGAPEGWQTRRFCTYPQEITLQFYGVVNIKKIQLVSHHSKISSQVDILYYVPVSSQEQRFYKYGYLQFSRNEGNFREQKTIMVDINCLYIRFLFHKPFASKQNFFSQVGLLGLSLFGSQTPEALLQESQQIEQQEVNEDAINQEDEEYIQERISKVTKKKEEAIANQDYESAGYFKNTINIIFQLRQKLRQNRVEINKAIQNEDYQRAKEIKGEIARQKVQIDQILEDGPDNQFQPELQQNQFAEIQKSEPGNQFMEPSHLTNSRHSRQSSKMGHSRPIQHHQPPPPPAQNYDQRVIPTMRPGHVKTEPDEGVQEKPKAPPPVEEVEGKYIKDATILQQYFDEEVVKKFFSVHWQHNLDSLTNIHDSLPTKQKDVGLIKCLITVVKYSSKQVNFQVSLQSQKVFLEMLKINGESQALSKPGDQQNDLDQIGKQIVKRLTDNNAKIKTASEQSFAQMTSSLLYGVQACSHLLAKYKGKLSSRQIITRLTLLNKMVEQYGLGGGNSVPPSSLQFATENANNPAEQARKLSIAMLGTAFKKDPNRTQAKIVNLKENIQDQIREGGVISPPVKHKKK